MPNQPQTWTYTGISRDQLEKLAEQLGRPFTALGEAETHGVRIGWAWEASDQTLTVTCYNQTWLVKFGRVKEEIDNLLGVTS